MKKEILIVLLAIETFLMALGLLEINLKINDLKKENELVHEYILNRIGG